MADIIGNPEEEWEGTSKRATLITEDEEHRLNLRLLRSGMGVLRPETELLRDSEGKVLASGWMTVPATPPWHRLIQDRRPANATERGLGWARLGRGSLLTRLVLGRREHVRALGDDLETFFYGVRSPPSHVSRNACGRGAEGSDESYVDLVNLRRM